MPKRNILFIVIDQLRADVINGPLGAAVDLPNLRAFRDTAVSFDQHYSVTNPCGPSRASILTGQYAMNHGATRNGTPLPADTPNFATEIRKAGYLPLLYGYTDSAQDPRGRDPMDPSLKTYEEVMPGFVEACEMRLEESWPWRADLLAKGYTVPPYPDIFRPQGDRITAPALYKAEDSDTAFLTNQMITDLRARPPGWCAHLTWIRPHPPLVAPAPYNTLVDPGSVPPPLPAQDLHPFDGSARRAKPLASNVEGFPDLPDTPETVAQLRALYLGLAAEVDHHFGRVIAFLKDSGLYDTTVVVVTADHGEMLGDGGFWGKVGYLPSAFHVPLMIRDPDRAQAHGTGVTQPTEAVDVTPTLLALAGVDVPDAMNGHSLVPFLEGQTPSTWRNSSFSELDFGNPLKPNALQQGLGLRSQTANLSILRSGAQTLVHFNGGLPPLLLETEQNGTLRNRADEPEAQKSLLHMTQCLLSHRMTHARGQFGQTLVTGQGVRRGDH